MADKDEIEFFNRTEEVLLFAVPRSEFTWLPLASQRVSLQFENEESIYRIVDVTFRFKHHGTVRHTLGYVEYLKQQAGRAPGAGDLEEKTEAVGIRIDVEPI